MKKIIVLLVLLLFPMVVMADAAVPEINKYEAVVVSEGGANAYDRDSKPILLKKDTVVEVIGESDDFYYIEYNGLVYSISRDAIKPKNSEVKPTDFKNVSKMDKLKLIVKDKNGAYIRKGPAYIYDVADKVSNGYKATFEYAYGKYIYIDNKGWLNTKEAKVYVENNTNYIITEEFESSCGKIPVNTIFEKPYTVGVFSTIVVLEYKGCSVEVDSFHNEKIARIDRNNKYKALEDIKIYKTPDKESEVLGTIKKGELFYDKAAYYDPNYDENKEGKETYNSDNKARNYVDYNGIVGWADLGDYSTVLFMEDNNKKEDPEEEEPKEDKDTEDKDIEEESKRNNKLVLYCVIGGVALALGAVAVIVLINKKKVKDEKSN